MDITIKDAYQVVEKVVSAGGNSGRVYVPRDWIGKRVKIVLIQPTNGDIVEDDKNA
jgi:putative transposon-encoded protein